CATVMRVRCSPPRSSISASTAWARPSATWPRPACPCASIPEPEACHERHFFERHFLSRRPRAHRGRAREGEPGRILYRQARRGRAGACGEEVRRGGRRGGDRRRCGRQEAARRRGGRRALSSYGRTSCRRRAVAGCHAGTGAPHRTIGPCGEGVPAEVGMAGPAGRETHMDKPVPGLVPLEDNISPYRTFTREEWAKLRADTPLTLTAEEVVRLQSLNDPISLAEVAAIYLPLSRLLSLYVAATQGLFRATQRFLLAEEDGK